MYENAGRQRPSSTNHKHQGDTDSSSVEVNYARYDEIVYEGGGYHKVFNTSRPNVTAKMRCGHVQVTKNWSPGVYNLIAPLLCTGRLIGTNSYPTRLP